MPVPLINPEAAVSRNWIRARITSIRTVIRLSPHDTSTDAGRAAERHRRAALTTLAAVFNKVISVGVLLITVPLTLRYLGQEQYGLWMTISALISMMGFLDMGIGNGLVSAISETDGKGDRETARRYVSAAVFALLTICVLLLLGFALGYSHIRWKWVLNVKTSEAARDGGQAAAVLIACFALGMPFSIAQRVQQGYQEGFRNNLWGSLGTVLTLVGILVAIWFARVYPGWWARRPPPRWSRWRQTVSNFSAFTALGCARDGRWWTDHPFGESCDRGCSSSSCNWR